MHHDSETAHHIKLSQHSGGGTRVLAENQLLRRTQRRGEDECAGCHLLPLPDEEHGEFHRLDEHTARGGDDDGAGHLRPERHGGGNLHRHEDAPEEAREAEQELADHIGLFPIIIASPNDSTLISGGSDERRRLMDIVISQYDSEYMTALTAYNKALQQRNALLKAEEEPNEEIMAVFEEMMAENGERIYRKRQAFIEEFTPVFQHFYSLISGGDEEVSLQYTSHGQRGNLLDIIQRDRQKDRIMGYSLHGIHKDELEMSLGGFPIKREGSQGQNKTYIISLKLAQFDFLKRTGSKTTPLLLLDDIFDKLDAQRVEQIVNLVASDAFGQIFITDTNREHLDKILERVQGEYKIFQVEGGHIL